MANEGYDDILKQTAEGIIEDCKLMGDRFTPEQETRFIQYVQSLVDAEPPTPEQIWHSVEIATEAIRAKTKEKSLRTINVLLLESISAFDPSSGVFAYLSTLNEAKDAIKKGLFDRAADCMFTFLNKCREAARSMQD